jgi:hypothetical protein
MDSIDYAIHTSEDEDEDNHAMDMHDYPHGV